MKQRPSTYLLRCLPVAIFALLLAACASIGNPEGGPRDFTTPRVNRVNPPSGTLGFKGKRITINFNKNVQLDDAFNKVVVSPAQKLPPAISANGHTVTLEFRDTLRSNTTYTIDFADAIKDLNEGNILDGFATDFSTGDTLDSLRISGMVLEARTLEPAQGFIVGVYANPTDTSLTTLPFDRIAKTNAQGRFTIRNLKEGTYRIFAINDINRDYKWDRTEDVAFYDVDITPTTQRVERTDTLYSATGQDSLVHYSATRFLPNDLLLTWFNENFKRQYIADYKRPEQRRLTFNFGAPSDSMPLFTLVSRDTLDGLDLLKTEVAEYSAKRDSIQLWLRTPALIETDTLHVAASFTVLDSLDNPTWRTDTLRFVWKAPKKSKAQIEAEERAAKALDDALAKAARGDSAALDSINKRMPKKDFAISVDGGSTQEINQPLRLRMPVPVDTINPAGLHLAIKQDTLWVPLTQPELRLENPDKPLLYMADISWQPGADYKLTIDSAAVRDIYGVYNKALSHQFKTLPLSDYGSITFRISGLDSLAAVAELLNTQDAPVAVVPVERGVAQFSYLKSGTYYCRLFIDANGNGVWDGGNLYHGAPRQPEDVYYLDRKVNLKKNWDVVQDWNINALPVDEQKPFDILKNKPKDAKNPRPADEEELPALPPGVGGFVP